MIGASSLYLIIKSIPLEVTAQTITFTIANSYVLLAVPLFMFAGSIMNVSGITDKIFGFALTLVGRMPGSLGHVNVICSLIFSGTSGSALADIGGLGVMQIDSMTKAGYTKAFAAAITIASATIGPIFPPSIPIVVLAATVELSAVELLVGGIMPGLVLAIVLMITVAILAKIHDFPRTEKRATFAEIWLSFIRALPAILAPFILIGGMVSGLFSPTESAAVVVGYSLLLGFVVYRQLTWKLLVEQLINTGYATSTILFMVAAATLLSWVLTVERIPDMLATYLLGITQNRWVLMVFMNIVLLIVGCFMCNAPAILIFAPIFMPIMVKVGFDPIHVGLVFVFNLMIGLITPPVGLSLFLVSIVAKEKMGVILKQTFPFLIALFIALILVTFIPEITIFVPKLIIR
jgi:tripartite ATP-independent transporter DctM subunit